MLVMSFLQPHKITDKTKSPKHASYSLVTIKITFVVRYLHSDAFHSLFFILVNIFLCQIINRR